MTASLWSRRDRAVWSTTVAIAATLWLWSWWSVRSTSDLGEQITFPSVSALGLVLAAGAHVGWIVRGRRAIGRRSNALLGGLVQDVEVTEGDVVAVPHSLLVAGRGLRWYHRPDCAMAAGRRWRRAARATHERAGRAPCGVCRP